MADEFERDEFEEWLKEGLKISHGMNLDLLPDDELPCLLPRAPAAFAFVADISAVDSGADVVMPVMIPLPMGKFSVKARLLAGSNSMHVCFKATWSVRFVNPGHFCDIFIAAPAPMAPHFMGMLDVFRVEVPNCSKPHVKPCFTRKLMFDDLYFIQRPQVDGGSEVRAYFSFTLGLFPSPSGVFSFSIPLCFPFYTKEFCGEKELQVAPISGSRRCRIRVFLRAKVGQIIRDYSVNYPLQVIMKYEDYIILLQESEGPDEDWPGATLTCHFEYKDKEPTGCDRPTYEMVEPPEKKMCLGTTAF